MNGKRQKQAVRSSLRPELVLAFLFGVTFCSVLAYAGLRETPITDPGQFFFLRVLAALSAAGIATVIPGFLHLQLSPARILQLRAGGALAVFAIVYFVNPPILVSKEGLPPDNKVIADILAYLTSTSRLHWNTPVLQNWSGNTERGEANRPYEITSQLADDNFKYYHRGAAIYKLFGNDEWRLNRLFVSEDSTRLLDGPPPSAEYLKKVVMDAGREPRTLPFLWDTVWVYEIRIPKDPHFERISTNEFRFDAVIVCDQRSGSEIITEERSYTFRRYPKLLVSTELQTKRIHKRKINPGESVRLLRDLPGRIDDAYGQRE